MTCAVTYSVAMGAFSLLGVAAAITSGAERIAQAIEKRREESPK